MSSRDLTASRHIGFRIVKEASKYAFRMSFWVWLLTQPSNRETAAISKVPGHSENPSEPSEFPPNRQADSRLLESAEKVSATLSHSEIVPVDPQNSGVCPFELQGHGALQLGCLCHPQHSH